MSDAGHGPVGVADHNGFARSLAELQASSATPVGLLPIIHPVLGQMAQSQQRGERLGQVFIAFRQR